MSRKFEFSKKQLQFLNEFLKTKTLFQWMPYFVAAVSKEKNTYSTLPPNLLKSIQNKLNLFQNALDTAITANDQNYSEDEIIRYFTGLSEYEFLFEYGKSIKNDSFHLDQIPIVISAQALGVLAELREIITGPNGLFSKDFDLERYVDQFIYTVGGKRVTDLIKYNPARTPDNADYYFELFNTIIELKLIKTDHLKTKAEKIKAQKDKILQLTKNDTPINAKRKLDLVEFNILRSSLMTATKSANIQIKNTRIILKKPQAKAFIFFINDGFYSINPYDLIELIWDPIKRNFSGIYGIFWANFRRLAEIETDTSYFIFEQRTKKNTTPMMSYFINRFGAQWLDYPYLLVGKYPAKKLISKNPSNLKNATWKKPNKYE